MVAYYSVFDESQLLGGTFDNYEAAKETYDMLTKHGFSASLSYITIDVDDEDYCANKNTLIHA